MSHINDDILNLSIGLSNMAYDIYFKAVFEGFFNINV